MSSCIGACMVGIASITQKINIQIIYLCACTVPGISLWPIPIIIIIIIIVPIGSSTRRIQSDQLCLEAILLAVPRFGINWQQQVSFPYEKFIYAYYRLTSNDWSLRIFRYIFRYTEQIAYNNPSYGYQYQNQYATRYIFVTLGRGNLFLYTFESEKDAYAYYYDHSALSDLQTVTRRILQWYMYINKMYWYYIYMKYV